MYILYVDIDTFISFIFTHVHEHEHTCTIKLYVSKKILCFRGEVLTTLKSIGFFSHCFRRNQDFIAGYSKCFLNTDLCGKFLLAPHFCKTINNCQTDGQTNTYSKEHGFIYIFSRQTIMTQNNSKLPNFAT